MADSKQAWYKKWWGAMIIIFFAIILFFLASSFFYFLGEVKNANVKPGPETLALNGARYEADNPSAYRLGSRQAKIKIVEFGDFACPVCEQAFPIVRELSVKYKDDIQFVWRDYPVVSDYSVNLALAARCAGEQDLFWPMHDKLFQNQGVGQTDQAVDQTNELVNLANQAGVDVVKFKDCWSKQKYHSQILKDLSDGQSFSIAGTPTYFINGYKVTGNIPYNTFVQIIEELKR